MQAFTNHCSFIIAALLLLHEPWNWFKAPSWSCFPSHWGTNPRWPAHTVLCWKGQPRTKVGHSMSKGDFLAVTMEPARQASGISGSTTAASSRIKVLFQLLTDYSVKHPNKSQFRIKKSDITGLVLPGSPGQSCCCRRCLLHSWHSPPMSTIKSRT